MSRELKPGDAMAVENTEEPGCYFAMGPPHESEDAETSAEADAAQINAALAVVERVRAAKEELEARLRSDDFVESDREYNRRKGAYYALCVVLEPDAAVRATMPGAEWLGGGR